MYAFSMTYSVVGMLERAPLTRALCVHLCVCVCVWSFQDIRSARLKPFFMDMSIAT